MSIWSDDILTTYPQDSQVTGITLHWSVSKYDQLFPEYHLCITGDGIVHLTTPIFTNNQFNKAAHLWHRNTGNIGVSVMAMYGATKPSNWSSPSIYTFPKEYGAFPPTKPQIDSLCTTVAHLANYFNLDSLSQIHSHAYWAYVDGYPDERWDFKYEGQLLKNEIIRLRG